jgi:hypothetical protein
LDQTAFVKRVVLRIRDEQVEVAVVVEIDLRDRENIRVDAPWLRRQRARQLVEMPGTVVEEEAVGRLRAPGKNQIRCAIAVYIDEGRGLRVVPRIGIGQISGQGPHGDPEMTGAVVDQDLRRDDGAAIPGS